MGQRILLSIFILASFWADYELWFSGNTPFDGWVVFAGVISATFKVLSGIYLYKNIVGYDKFEYSEGFRLKRKK